jgi:surface polysaccharide O-acyltransferase-like enzyme
MTETARPARAAYLDLFKTLLIWGMVSTHVVQLITFGPPRWLVGFTEFINLITFSGFMLAFGLGVGLSTREPRGLAERLKPALMLLAATWVSSLAFVVLVDRRPVTPALLVDLFSLRVLFGWSEFLASFFTLYLLIALVRPLFVRLATNGWVHGAATLACLAATLITTGVDLPLLATLIGTTNYASFPVIPYLPWFLVGIHLARRNRAASLLEWLLAAFATGAFVWVLVSTGELPQRFPPSALWVAGAVLPLALYLAASRLIAARLTVPALLLAPGRHVLASLLVSNLLIFAVRYLYGRPLRAWWWALLASLALLALVTLWGIALDLWRARRRMAVRS